MTCDNCRANGICEGIVGDCERTHNIADKIYQQGRADAIDEMIDFFENKAICLNNECIHMDDECGCVRCIAEQLKEQKNE